MSVRVDVVGMSLVLALCVSMPGCKKAAESASPNVDAAGEAQSPHDSADPLAELAALEGRMQALGLPVATNKEKGATMQSEGGEDRGEGEMSDAVSAGAAGDGQPVTAEEAPAPTPTAHQVDTTEPARDDRNYCGDLCSLSESICTLEVRICSLAESHTNDSVYADACERAVEDCELAGQACDGCG